MCDSNVIVGKKLHKWSFKGKVCFVYLITFWNDEFKESNFLESAIYYKDRILLSKISTFSGHITFPPSSWFSENSKIISWLIFKTQMECVYCAVKSESLNMIQTYLLILPMLHTYFHLSMCCCYRKDKGTMSGNFRKKQCSSGNWERCLELYFHLNCTFLERFPPHWQSCIYCFFLKHGHGLKRTRHQDWLTDWFTVCNS
jgi:hypothetical protein